MKAKFLFPGVDRLVGKRAAGEIRGGTRLSVNDALEISPWKKVKLSLLLLLAMGATVQAFDAGPFVIPLKSDPPPAVDGQLNEWINRPGVLMLDRREQVTLGNQVWKS